MKKTNEEAIKEIKRDHINCILKYLFFLIIGWMLLSLIVYLANQIWHFNNNLNWVTSLIGGAITGFAILVTYSVAWDFVRSKRKVLFLIGVIVYILIRLVVYFLRTM